MEGGELLDLSTFMGLDLRGEARLRGTVVHAWCEAIKWMDDGFPDDPDLFAEIPHGAGQTVLREALLTADHNAYHLGQLMFMRRIAEANAG